MSLQLLCTVLVLFSSYYLILLCYLAGHYNYPEDDLLAPGILVSVEECGEVAALRSIGRF